MVSKAAPKRPKADGKIDQVISEPGKFIGDITHKVLFTAGEVGPEGLQIIPLTKNRAAPKARRAMYDGGGDVAFDIDARDRYVDDIRDKMPYFPSPLISGLNPDEMRQLYDLQWAAWQQRRLQNDYGPPMGGGFPLPLWRPSDRAVKPDPNAVPENLSPAYNHNENPLEVQYKTGGDIAVRPRSKAAPRPRRYSTGGDLVYDPSLLNDPDIASKVASGQVRFDPGANTIGAYGGAPPTTSVASTPAPVQQPAFAPAQPTQPYGAAGTAIYNASGQVQSSTQADINASRNVNAASATELAAKRNALTGENAYLDTQSSDNAFARSEEQARQAAENNVADKTAVAQAQRVQDNQDQLYGAFGLSKPIDVALPAGATSNPAAPGIRAKLQTQEEIVTNQNADASKLRTFNTEDSRLAASKLNQVAASAGLDVSGAQLAERGTALDVRQANLAEDLAQRPPAPNMVLDPYSGNFVTKDEFNSIAASHGVTYDPVNKAYVTQDQLHQNTDPAGNILRTSDGTWVNPKNGNELINGTWTDVKTGNTFDPSGGPQGAWLAPDGNKFIVTSAGGGGYWQNAQGYVLESDGTWRDPVSGAEIINGVVYTPQQLSAMRSTRTGGTGSRGGGGRSSSSSSAAPVVTPTTSFGNSTPAAPAPAAPAAPAGSPLSAAERKYQMPGLSSFIP